jgi:hypothetical protein
MTKVRWLASGSDAYGEPLSWTGEDRAKVDEQARRVNKRGGRVVVYRQVYDSPAARWIDREEEVRP